LRHWKVGLGLENATPKVAVPPGQALKFAGCPLTVIGQPGLLIQPGELLTTLEPKAVMPPAIADAS
jgi:hypothetical protein